MPAVTINSYPYSTYIRLPTDTHFGHTTTRFSLWNSLFFAIRLFFLFVPNVFRDLICVQTEKKMYFVLLMLEYKWAELTSVGIIVIHIKFFEIAISAHFLVRFFVVIWFHILFSDVVMRYWKLFPNIFDE